MTEAKRYPRPPMRFPGLAGSVPAHERGPRRWILGHCGGCTLPLLIAGLYEGTVRVWAAVKTDNDGLRCHQATAPDWPAHGTWVAHHAPWEEPLPWPSAIHCTRCNTRHPLAGTNEEGYLALRDAYLTGLAARAIAAGARRFTIGRTP